MVNWWLIVVVVIVVLLTFGLSAYVIFAFTTPSELKVAIFPKIVALLGLSLTCFAILMLPYDCANRKDPTAVNAKLGGGIDTVLMWQIIFWAAFALILVLIPFAMFFYEAHDPEQFSFLQQIIPAFLYTLGIIVVFLIIFLALFFSIGYAVIPYYQYSALPQTRAVFDPLLTYEFTKSVQTLELRVSAFVYMVGVLCALGWVFFLMYGGVGIVAVPVGLSRLIYKMPKKPLDDAEFMAEQERIATKAMQLIKQGQALSKSTTQDFKQQRTINKFQAEVSSLENELAKVTAAHDDRNFHYVRLAFIMFAILLTLALSVLWILHIFIYNATNTNGFLNVMLIRMDQTFSLLGTLAYGLFAFYLLWCTVVGCIRVGLRVTCFQIHPMKYRDTRINSILFNVGLVLVTSVAVVQFCAFSFAEYASNTAVDVLFDTYVRRLKYIGQMFPYFQFCLVAIAVLSTFWVICCPRPKPKEKKEEEDD